jgi:hypothetical protein
MSSLGFDVFVVVVVLFIDWAISSGFKFKKKKRGKFARARLISEEVSPPVNQIFVNISENFNMSQFRAIYSSSYKKTQKEHVFFS